MPVTGTVEAQIPRTLESELQTFLWRRFKPAELKVLVLNQLPRGEEIAAKLPAGSASMYEIAGELAPLLVSNHEWEALRQALLLARPGDREEIEKIWALPRRPALPTAPTEVFAGVEDLAREIDLAHKVNGLVGTLPLHILFAFSSPLGPFNLFAERASLIKMAQRAFIDSNLGKKFAVQLLEWCDHGSVRDVSTADDTDKRQDMPPLSDLDVVIIVVWHDLGAQLPEPLDGENELSQLAAQVRNRNAEATDAYPRLLLFRRAGIQFSGDDTDAAEASRRYERVKAFFDRLRQDEYVAYVTQTFSSQMERNLRVVVSGLLDHTARIEPDRFKESPLAPQPRNPYRGLKHYDEKHSAAFYGRADEINQLAEQFADLMDRTRIVAVVGGSGSGKSSLVRAGLLPHLRLNGIPGSGQWRYHTLRLSEDSERPLDVIADHLTDAAGPSSDRKARRALLHEDPTTLTPLIEPLLAGRPPDARVVMFIDQFEELFTLVNAEERASCVQVLEKAVNTPRLLVVVTLRSEFYHRCLGNGLSPLLAERLKASTYWLLPPDRRALLAMITRPALFAGAVFSDVYLPVKILDDAGTSSGALPLVSCTLELLYRKSPTGILSRETYDIINGETGVIQQLGDEALSEVRRQVGKRALDRGLRVVFRNLVGVDETGTATKRPARRSRFTSRAAVRLVDALVDQRLLTSDLERGVRVVSVAHEAVLSRWSVLAGWIHGAHDALVLMHQMDRAAQEWRQQRDAAQSDAAKRRRDRNLLWRQDRLDEVHGAMDLLGTTTQELTPAAVEFLRPEFDRLCTELSAPVGHTRRAEIGERLADLRDRRPGQGLTKGIPDIDWCWVTGGKVTLRDRSDHALGTFDVAPFEMARYPVTLEQFRAFTQEKVYNDLRWWSGLPVGPYDHRPYPQSPDVAIHPAQWVSWYQALAFCAWLSDALGYPIRLPTEAEWVQAATAGHPDYVYPWGREWDPERANHRESLYRLISVGMYPDGASPAGVYDLSGNMYQWCLNEFDDLSNLDHGSAQAHPTRGGAFFTMPPNIEVRDQLSIYHRLRDNPDGTGDRGQRIAVGIRLVRDAQGL